MNAILRRYESLVKQVERLQTALRKLKPPIKGYDKELSERDSRIQQLEAVIIMKAAQEQKNGKKDREQVQDLKVRLTFPDDHYEDLSALSMKEKLDLPVERILPLQEKMLGRNRSRRFYLLYALESRVAGMPTVKEALELNAPISNGEPGFLRFRGVGRVAIALFETSIAYHGIKQ